MWEKNIAQRLILIAVVLVLAAALIRDPRETIRPGLDIAGGVSLIYEIDDRGLKDDQMLAERMKELLRKRVDPKGVYDLTWRVHGRNRLEVQMPMPPPGVAQKRQEFAAALDALFQNVYTRESLNEAFAKSGEAREQAIVEMAEGSPEREALLREAAAAYDRYIAALEAVRQAESEAQSAPAQTQPAEGDEQAPEAPPAEEAPPVEAEAAPAEAETSGEAVTPPGEEPTPPEAAARTQPAPAAETQPTTTPAQQLEALQDALFDAEEDLADAYDQFLRTNLQPTRFREILEMDAGSQTRQSSLQQMKEQHPQLREQIDNVLKLHAEWRQNRGYLDGPQDLQRLLRGSGVLEFRILAEPSPANAAKYDRYREQLHERGPMPVAGDEFGWFRIDNPLAFLNLKTPAELEAFDPAQSGYVVERDEDAYYVLAKLLPEHGMLQTENWQLRNAMVSRDAHGRPCVDFELDVVGGSMFGELTRKNIGQPLCILVDDTAYSAPNIQSKITTRGQITGDFSMDKVQYLAQTMQAGSLPARLKETPISERTIGSSLGATNRDLAFRAGIIGVVVVALFMAIYYMAAGLVANVALLLNIALVLAVMALLQARFTLAGIAGVILTIGMSVDANVLIFERMREERERGSSLRLILKNGYDKAFSTIIDANVTTLLTCVILYYVGSEEIKGFGLTLGWGIVISLFTALFVTRTIFAVLLKYGLLKDIKMLRFIGVPKIDWYAKRKFFVPTSLIIVLIGLTLLIGRGKDVFDVEFRGGISAELEVLPPEEGQEPLTDRQIRNLLEGVGQSIAADAPKLQQAVVTPVIGEALTHTIHVPGVSSERLMAMLNEPLEEQNWLARGGLTRAGAENAVEARMRDPLSAEELQTFIRGLSDMIAKAGQRIAGASVGSVIELGFDEQTGKYWTVTTTEKNKRLVEMAIEEAVGDRLARQNSIDFVFRGDQRDHPFPITGPRLENVINNPHFPVGAATTSVGDYIGGAAMFFDDLSPPQSVRPDVAGSLADRLRNMRLQPGYQEYPWRRFAVVGVEPTEQVDDKGSPLYRSAVVVVADENFRYSDDPELWYTNLALPEFNLASTALESEQSLRKVSQFKPQIAQRATTQASLALLLSWAMIIGYLWIRFGRPMYGIAGVAALIHDVCIALAFVGIAHWIGGKEHPLGAFFLIDDFKIDMTIVAAFLTIIGYSINDTIVVFDRIRETRGRLGHVTPQIINDSINQCMARTLLTSLTTLMILLIMYIFGGSSIRGFNYCMIIGVLTGTYSSIAVAAPLLMLRTGPTPASAR